MKKIFSLVFIGVLCFVLLGCTTNDEHVTSEGMIRVGNELLGYIDIPEGFSITEGDVSILGHMTDMENLVELSFGITIPWSAETLEEYLTSENSLINQIRNNDINNITYDGPFSTNHISGHKIVYNTTRGIPIYSSRYIFEANGNLIAISFYSTKLRSTSPVFLINDNLIDTYRKDR